MTNIVTRPIDTALAALDALRRGVHVMPHALPVDVH
jgi:hypothetical protein